MDSSSNTILLADKRLDPIRNLKDFGVGHPPFVLGKFRYGTMIYYYYDLYISTSLEQYGEWAQVELDFLCDILEPGDTVVDIGAFIGTHTLSFAHKVGTTGKVFAFEPTKESFRCLVGNLMINGAHDVEVFQAALGKEEGTLDVTDIGGVTRPNNYGGMGAVEYYPIKGKISQEYIKQVEMRTLDSFNIEKCKLIKIDAEGMSLEVLEGAKNTIQKCKPCFLAEIETPAMGAHIMESKENQKLVEFIKDVFDYDVYNATSLLFNPNNYFKNPNNIFGTIASFGVFCCPTDWTTVGLEKLR